MPAQITTSKTSSGSNAHATGRERGEQHEHKNEAAHRRRSRLCAMRLRRVFVGVLPNVEASQRSRAAAAAVSAAIEKAEEHPRPRAGNDGAFTSASLRSRGFAPAPRHFSTTTGVCSSLLPCGLSSSAASTLFAQTPLELREPSLFQDRWHRRRRTRCRVRSHKDRAKPSGSRGAKTMARSYGRHRAGVSVEGRDRFAHHS